MIASPVWLPYKLVPRGSFDNFAKDLNRQEEVWVRSVSVSRLFTIQLDKSAMICHTVVNQKQYCTVEYSYSNTINNLNDTFK